MENYLDNKTVSKLIDIQSNGLKGKLTYVEVIETLKHKTNDKRPGFDVFSLKFSKVFWNKMCKFVVRALNHAFDLGELSIYTKNRYHYLYSKR